jgi:hypothetical protein
MWVRKRRRPRQELAEETRTDNGCCNLFGRIRRNSDLTIGRLSIEPPFQFSMPLKPVEARFLIQCLQQTQVLEKWVPVQRCLAEVFLVVAIKVLRGSAQTVSAG